MRNALGQVQSVLVLGGGSEIAQAIVGQLIDGGCRTVLLAARHPESLTADVESMRARGATTVEVMPFDALLSDGHAELVDKWFERFGDIDVAVLAFGVLGDQADFDADPASAAEAARANYVGAVSSGIAVANRMRAQGHGTIVVLSSVAGERVRKANFVYGSSKAGLDAFAQGLGDSLAGSGVHVTVVRPGFVHSKMTTGMAPAPFATTPDAVAHAVVKGIAANRAVIWVPGPLRWVMAAFRHLPRGVWRKVSARA